MVAVSASESSRHSSSNRAMSSRAVIDFLQAASRPSNWKQNQIEKRSPSSLPSPPGEGETFGRRCVVRSAWVEEASRSLQQTGARWSVGRIGGLMFLEHLGPAIAQDNQARNDFDDRVLLFFDVRVVQSVVQIVVKASEIRRDFAA